MKSKLLLLAILFVSLISKAADYYWVNGSGNWSDFSNHWATTSGGSSFHTQVPTPADDVIFDANSFAASGQIVTIDQAIAEFRNMSWTGVTNTPMFNSPGNRLRIFGSLTLVHEMNATINGSVDFMATATGQTISSADKSFVSINFDGDGGGWMLQDELKAIGGVTLFKGTLTTNNQTISTGSFNVVSTGTEPSVLNAGSSVFNLANVWTGSSNAVINTVNASINMSQGTFIGGGHIYNNFTGTVASGNVFFSDGDNTFTGTVIFGGNASINGNNTFANLIFSPGQTYKLTPGTTQTITSSFTATGNCNSFINIDAGSISQAFIKKATGTIALSYVELKGIAAVGGAIFTISNALDYGNNSGWTITSSPTPANLYWVGNGGNWNDGNHWSTSSGGAPAGCAPTPLDNVFFDANSFTQANQTVTINSPVAQCHDMSWTGVTNTPMFNSPGNTLRIFGSLTLVPEMNATITGSVYFMATTTGQTISSAGKSFVSINFDGEGGGWTLEDGLKIVGETTLSKGTLNTNNQTITTSGFNVISTGTEPTILNAGSSVFNLSGVWTGSSEAVINTATSTINLNQGFHFFSGGGHTYYNLNGTSTSGNIFFGLDDNTFKGTVTLEGNASINGNNTFENLIFSSGHTYTLASGSTQTITTVGNFAAQGNVDFPIRIQSGSQGETSTILKSAGSICLDYVRMSDMTATGGAFFNAGLSPTRSLDMGGNTGWVFTGDSNHFFADGDGDGYGNKTLTTLSCTPPIGYVADSTDCNDANAAVNPGAIEICNGIDDDCDGLIDENVCTPIGSLSLGNRVWKDINNNGKDNNEPGVGNVLMKLYKVANNTGKFSSGTFIASTTTNATGNYLFDGLIAGKYVVVVIKPTGYTKSSVNGGNPDNNIDKDNNGKYSNKTQIWGLPITLTANGEPNGSTNTTYDFGLRLKKAGEGDDEDDKDDDKSRSDIAISAQSKAENINERGLNVYPNPSKGDFTISVNMTDFNSNSGNIQIVNMSGQIVKQINVANQQTVNITLKENSGIYLIHLITGKQVVTKKITVIK